MEWYHAHLRMVIPANYTVSKVVENAEEHDQSAAEREIPVRVGQRELGWRRRLSTSSVPSTLVIHETTIWQYAQYVRHRANR